MAREALILTIRVEVPDDAVPPMTWPEARELLIPLGPLSTRVELLNVKED